MGLGSREETAFKCVHRRLIGELRSCTRRGMSAQLYKTCTNKRKSKRFNTVSSAKKTAQVTEEVDVALVGGGIMSATLGAMLRELEPSWTQMVFERLDGPALESSSPWNNAGTGHSALCELNYTP